MKGVKEVINAATNATTSKPSSSPFRKSFKFPISFTPAIFNKTWPKHMAVGVLAMRARTTRCDCLIEIRDARVPLSSHNPQFNFLSTARDRIVLINKIDLADRKRTQELVKKHIVDDFTKVIYTNCRRNSSAGVKNLMKSMKELVAEKDELKTNTEEYLSILETINELNLKKLKWKVKDSDFKAIVYGIPNVGKSSLINALRSFFTNRNSKATPVGKMPGVTKSVLQSIIVSDDPKITIFDTPGIIPPHITNPLVGIKLALAGTFPDHLIGEDVIADYLLYTLNKHNNTLYLEMCGLAEPSDDFDHVIESHSEKHGFTRQKRKPDYMRSSQMLIKAYRDGEFGQITLD